MIYIRLVLSLVLAILTNMLLHNLILGILICYDNGGCYIRNHGRWMQYDIDKFETVASVVSFPIWCKITDKIDEFLQLIET